MIMTVGVQVMLATGHSRASPASADLSRGTIQACMRLMISVVEASLRFRGSSYRLLGEALKA